MAATPPPSSSSNANEVHPPLPHLPRPSVPTSTTPKQTSFLDQGIIVSSQPSSPSSPPPQASSKTSSSSLNLLSRRETNLGRGRKVRTVLEDYRSSRWLRRGTTWNSSFDGSIARRTRTSFVPSILLQSQTLPLPQAHHPSSGLGEEVQRSNHLPPALRTPHPQKLFPPAPNVLALAVIHHNVPLARSAIASWKEDFDIQEDTEPTKFIVGLNPRTGNKVQGWRPWNLGADLRKDLAALLPAGFFFRFSMVEMSMDYSTSVSDLEGDIDKFVKSMEKGFPFSTRGR